ncbi:ComEA family DNA-binding protein [Flaviaesturariibacter terrae]
MNPKRVLADYFTFAKKDRLAAILLAAVVGALLAAPSFFPDRPLSLQPLPDSLLRRPADSLRSDGYRQDDPERRYRSRYPKTEGDRDAWQRAPLFAFDPNSLDAAGWARLGLPARTVQTILKYRDRGGRFRQPDDLRKIWSLPPGFVDRVLPFIRLPEKDAAGFAATAGGPRSYPQAGDRAGPRKRWAPAPISINEADSAAWEALPGIGAKLAGRIVRYRERLGGFGSVEQVGETWGVPDSTFQKIKPLLKADGGAAGVRKLNLNSASKDELKNHPYIRWKYANAIVEYRERHGKFGSVEELRRLLILPDSTLKRLLPYLSVE